MSREGNGEVVDGPGKGGDWGGGRSGRRSGWAGQGIVRGVEGSGGREGSLGRIGGREKSGGRRVAAGEGEECWGGRAMGAGSVVGGEGEKWRQEKGTGVIYLLKECLVRGMGRVRGGGWAWTGMVRGYGLWEGGVVEGMPGPGREV